MNADAALVASLADALGLDAGRVRATPVSGGDINAAATVSDGRREVFVKFNDAPASAAMFEAEVDGLAALAATGTVRVPEVIGRGEHAGTAWLALEPLALRGGNARAASRLGAALASLHRVTDHTHGWHCDNTLGTTPQHNAPLADWPAFWAQRRLAPQLELAAHHGAPVDLLDAGRRLLDRLDALLDHSPPPSLLHGDLWGGNWGALPDGTPAIFDPAVYRGDREADLAMTRLFGGFGSAFDEAYMRAWPLPAGWERRLPVYQLYHVLNHFNLFGGGYAAHARRLIDTALSD